MIDLHCHILPQMDDGSESFEESVNMVKTALSNKTEAIIATPHFLNYNDIDGFVFSRDSKLKALNEINVKNGYRVVVGAGAEVYLDSRVFSAGDMGDLTINSSRYMLCEFSLGRFNPEHAMQYAVEILDRGYVPIIAHPERYITFLEYPDTVNELCRLGCRFQVNASSLAGRGGGQMQDFAKELILRNFADFIATDAHSSTKRGNDILNKIKDFPEEITKKMLVWMTDDAPMLVLKDEDLPERDTEFF